MKKLANTNMAALITMILFILATTALSAEPPPIPAAPTGVLTDPHDVETFFDGMIAEQLKIYHIPGATVSVVANGQILLAKGYGYADVEKHLPVIADRTLFRLASTSKLFTWTAVMQLVEKGKLHLNADVNDYLTDFKIPPAFGKPITIADLMSHTSGFDETPTGVYVARAEDMTPLASYVAHNVPARIRPPGELSAYCNYGATLAGYIVEKVSGVPFEQYVEENIFGPLGMTHTTFREPLPGALTPDLATGYMFGNDVYAPQEFEWIETYPAGSASSSATDMAKFMLAHLQDGRFGSAQILGEDAAREMHSRLFTTDPRVNGWAHGFMEMTLNGRHVIWHGGDIRYFHSALVLFPEQNVGVFVAYNSPYGALARWDLLDAFADRYFPATRELAPTPGPEAIEAAARCAGPYQRSWGRFSGMWKLSLFFSSPMLTAGGDGYLHAPGALGRPESRYLQIEPGIFRCVEADGTLGDTLVFTEDDHGNIKYAFFGNNPTMSLIKMPWYQGTPFHSMVINTCLIVLLSAVIVFPIGWLINRRRKHAPNPLLARLARICAWLLGVLSVIFFLGMKSFFLALNETAYEVPADVKALLIIPVVSALLAVIIVVLAVFAWVRKFWRLPGRIYYTLIAATAAVFVWWLLYWNQVGFLY